jgi:hypothetical protein
MSHTSLLTEDDVLGGRYRDRARAGWFAVGAKPIALFGSLAGGSAKSLAELVVDQSP